MRSPIIFIALFTLVSCDVTYLDKAMKTVKYCVAINNITLDSAYLVGTWYGIYKFAGRLNLVGTDYCPTTIFKKATKVDIDEYKVKYNLVNEAFSIDDHPLLVSERKGRLKGMLAGNKRAKYYFLAPKSAMRLMGMYEVKTYKPISEDYLIFYECKARGHVKWLWSRRNNQTEEEIQLVISKQYELNNMETQRFCVKKKFVSTTEFFK